MKRRTHQEWRELFDQQAQSGLSIAQFCQQHDIGQSYFYKRKNDLCPSPLTENVFIKAQTASIVRSSVIHIQYGTITMALPGDTTPVKLAELVKALT